MLEEGIFKVRKRNISILLVSSKSDYYLIFEEMCKSATNNIVIGICRLLLLFQFYDKRKYVLIIMCSLLGCKKI